MVFWKSSALSMDPKRARASPGWVTRSAGAACADGVRPRGAAPAAAAAPSPNPKNFLREIACILVPPEMGFYTTEGRYSHGFGESTMAKWWEACRPLGKTR